MEPIPLPSPGFGTMGIGDRTATAVEEALGVGYRHVDTAQKYGNEAAIGEGIARSAVQREEVVIATKIAETNLDPPDAAKSTRRSLDRLGLDVVDLLYVHWPAVTDEDDRYDPWATLPVLDELVDEGLVRHVGLANFDPNLLEEAREHLDAPIAAIQVEMHPLCQQRDLQAYADDVGAILVAHTPLLRGAVEDIPELRAIADRHDATPAQVTLAWLMEKGVVPIPRSSGAHIEENAAARDLDLDPNDVRRIDGIHRERRVVDPPKGPWNW